jgi:hypothetical protein
MVDLGEIQSAYYMVAATGVIVAAIYYVYNMNATRKTQENAQKTQELMLKSQEQTLETRQTQLFMQIYMRYLEPDLFSDNLTKLFRRGWKDLDDYLRKYSDNPDGADLNRMMTFYEGVSVLINRGMIDIVLVYELMPTNVTALWSRYGQLIKEMRRSGAPPRLYCLVEELSDKLATYAKEQGDEVVTDYTMSGLRPSTESGHTNAPP